MNCTVVESYNSVGLLLKAWEKNSIDTQFFSEQWKRNSSINQTYSTKDQHKFKSVITRHWSLIQNFAEVSIEAYQKQ